MIYLYKIKNHPQCQQKLKNLIVLTKYQKLQNIFKIHNYLYFILNPKLHNNLNKLI